MKSLKIPRGNQDRKSKMDRKQYDKKKMNKRTNNDLQSATQKTKDRATRTPIKTGDEFRCCGRVSSSCSTSDIRLLTLTTTGATGRAGTAYPFEART